jgi:hypothetical protein
MTWAFVSGTLRRCRRVPTVDESLYGGLQHRPDAPPPTNFHGHSAFTDDTQLACSCVDLLKGFCAPPAQPVYDEFITLVVVREGYTPGRFQAGAKSYRWVPPAMVSSAISYALQSLLTLAEDVVVLALRLPQRAVLLLADGQPTEVATGPKPQRDSPPRSYSSRVTLRSNLPSVAQVSALPSVMGTEADCSNPVGRELRPPPPW